MTRQNSHTAPEAPRLSPKQWKVLKFIQAELARLGRPPTYRDIAKHCGYDAVGTVQDHVRALLKKGFLQKEAGVARGLRLAHHIGAIDVPILGLVPAGHPIEAIESSLGSLPVPSNLRGDIFALRVTGESMIEAGIFDGDYVIVKKQSHAENGEIVVATIDGEATVKRLQKINDKRGTVTRLLPANPRFTPIELHAGAENVIQGRVVSVQRYY